MGLSKTSVILPCSPFFCHHVCGCFENCFVFCFFYNKLISAPCRRFSLKTKPQQKKNTSHLTHTHPPHSHPTPPSLLQEVVARVLNDGTDIVLQRGPASCRWQASIYRLQGTESRKGNISLSLDTQNATAVGGHRLQTEISSYISGRWCEGGRGRGGEGHGR